MQHSDCHGKPLDSQIVPPPVGQLMGEQPLQGLPIQRPAGQHKNRTYQPHQHGGGCLRAAHQLGRTAVRVGKNPIGRLSLLWGGPGTAQDAPGKPDIAHPAHHQHHTSSRPPHRPQQGLRGNRSRMLLRLDRRLAWDAGLLRDGQGPRLLGPLHSLTEQAVRGGPGAQKTQQHQNPKPIDCPGGDFSPQNPADQGGHTR